MTRPFYCSRYSPNKTIIPLIWFLTFFAAAALRFHALDRQSLWDDEMSTYRAISQPRGEMLHSLEVGESHPPLYFVQLRLWQRLAGRSLSALRANSAVWGCLAILLLYGWVRRTGGGRQAMVAMALAAFSPYQLAYSQELRSYAFGQSLALAGFWLIESLLAEDNQARAPLWIALAALWTAELYTHYWLAFVAAAQAGYAWSRSSRPGRLRTACCGVVAVGIFGLWMPALRTQVQAVNQIVFWAPKPSIANLLKTFVAFSGIYFRFASNAFQGLKSPILDGVVLASLGLAMMTGFRRGPSAARWWLVAVLGGTFALSFVKPSLYVWYRYPILVYPAFATLVAGGLLRLRARWAAPMLALWLGCEAWECAIYFSRWEKANPKSVVAYVHRIESPQSVVVRPSYFARLFDYYDEGRSRAVDQDRLASADTRAALGREIILIAFEVPSDPVASALLAERRVLASQHFPGFAHLGITVYRLK